VTTVASERKTVLLAVNGDDPGQGDLDLFRRYLAFFRGYGVRLTLFVVPFGRGRPLHEDGAWVAALKGAQDEGHDLQLHGLAHAAFEFGFPPDFMLARSPSVRRVMEDAAQRERIRQQLTVGALRAKLERAVELFRRALGVDPVGFRAPVLMVCDELFEALAQVGLGYDSSMALSPRGWHYITQRFAAPAGEPWDATLAWEPFRYKAGVVEIPLASEYSAHAVWDEVDRRAALMAGEFDRLSERGGVFAPLTHFHSMFGQMTYRRAFDEVDVTLELRGGEIYRRFFEHVRARGNATFCTLTEAYRAGAAAGPPPGRPGRPADSEGPGVGPAPTGSGTRPSGNPQEDVIR
jgi:peptidoglycan/xylan/chitin deacetylase (PgdA/CDA1 family)